MPWRFGPACSFGTWNFVQFFPLVLAEPRLPTMILYPPFPREVKLIDGDGNDLSSLHGAKHLMEAIMERRDTFSAALYERLETSGPVYLDYRQVPDSWWDRNPMKGLTKLKFDFRTTPAAIAPAAHFFMGGVRINDGGETDLPGLYACGEMVWGLHGANRRGGNALTECLVSGLLAGARAAVLARQGPLSLPPSEIRQVEYDPASSVVLIWDYQKRIREIAWNKAGVVRNGPGLQEGLLEVRDLEKEIGSLSPFDVQERKWLNDLRSAVLVVKAILTAGLGRKESRGSFIRKDFPHENLRDRAKNSCLTYQPANNEFTVRYPEAEG